MKKLVIAAFITLSIVAVPCFSEEKNQTAFSFNASDVAVKLASMLGSDSDITVFEESLLRLEEASQAFTPEDAQQVLVLLRNRETTIEQAEVEFDKMIDDIGKTQALGDPDGAFVEFMNKMQTKALQEADDATRDHSTKFAAAFTALAEEFGKIRDAAIQARNDAIPAIDFLKLHKKEYVRAKKIRAFSEIAVISESAVKKVEEQSESVRSAATDLRRVLDEPIAR